MLDFKVLDDEVTELIEKARLSRASNDFFLCADKTKEVSLISGFNIARNWREITKTFLFSVITSLGRLAEKINQAEHPQQDLLIALQKGFNIINDDLNNAHPIFKDEAPAGYLGIHYKWWEDSILQPLSRLVLFKDKWHSVGISPRTAALLKEMNCLSTHVFGGIIQMRVVEAIAFDISASFNKLFSFIKIDNINLFTTDSLAWIRTHIKAEKFHHKEVSDENSSILCFARSDREQQEILKMTKNYVSFWAEALSEFKSFLSDPA